MEDRGILDNYLECSFAFIINLVNREPENFKQVSFPGPNGQSMTALDMTLQLGQKCFEIAREKEDELWAINIVSLFSNLLENIKDISVVVPGIL